RRKWPAGPPETPAQLASDDRGLQCDLVTGARLARVTRRGRAQANEKTPGLMAGGLPEKPSVSILRG
ncbi:MAG: hypothetical protein ACOCYN_03695, partial [Planctomycetota bacterium]